MTYVHRLRVAGVLLTLAAVVTNSHVWGEPTKKLDGKRLIVPRNPGLGKADGIAEEQYANTKFTSSSVVTYRTTDGDLLFALQLKPKLDPIPARPRDYVIMVDTSASQVRGPLDAARDVARRLVTEANPADRISVWTVNIPKATQSLSRGFR